MNRLLDDPFLYGGSSQVDFVFDGLKDVNTNGWVSFALVSNDGTMLDVWWGGFDEDYATNYGQDGFAQFSNLQSGPRYPDTLQNLNLVSIQQAPFGETTRLRFTRSFTTIDYKQDVAIPLVALADFLYWFSQTEFDCVFLNRTRGRSSTGPTVSTICRRRRRPPAASLR